MTSRLQYQRCVMYVRVSHLQIVHEHGEGVRLFSPQFTGYDGLERPITGSDRESLRSSKLTSVDLR